MIIDSHTHLGEFPLFNVKLSSDEMIQTMDECKIAKSVVFSLPNETTLDAVKRHPSRLIGYVWINPHRGEEALQQIDTAVKEWGFKGVKMHPLLDSYLPDQDIVHPVMERAKHHNIPVLFHCGHPPWSLPWHFGNLADHFPDVKIILGHMGHGHIVHVNGSIDMAMKHENIFLETSAMPMHSKIKEAVDRVGEDRVLYGSDMPFGHPAVEILRIKVAGLTETQLNKVLSQNLLSLLQ